MSEAALPTGWTQVPLADVGKWVGGGTPSKSESRFWENGTIPWVSPKDMKEAVLHGAEDMITEAAVAQSATQIVQPGSVLAVTRSGILRHTLPVATNAVAVALNQDLKAMTPHDGFDAAYIAWALRAFESRILHECSKAGTTVQSIETSKLRSFKVPAAPSAEQRRIVAALEEYLSDLEAAVAGLERVRKRLEHYRRAILHDIASPAAAARLGWKVLPLGELASTSSGGTPNRSRPEFFGGGIPWLKSGELNDGFVSAAEESLTQAGLANSSAKLFPSGTLCIALYGATVGRLGVLDFEAATNQAICGIQPCDKVDKQWLFYVLLEGRQRLIDQGKGGAQSNISQGIVRAYPVPVPPHDKQRGLVAEIERNFAIADHTTTEINIQLARASRLRQSILKRAFEGKLVPQDPNDEPASVLLERIRADRTSPSAKPRRTTTTVR